MRARADFAGFPARAQATAIPNVFFTDVLPRLAGDAVARGRGAVRVQGAAGEAREPALRHGRRTGGAMRSLVGVS